MGYKKNPIYRIIVADSRSPRDGRFIEEIGTYDPNHRSQHFQGQNEELAKKWLNNGAQPTGNRRQDLQGSRNREIRQLCKADGYAKEQ